MPERIPATGAESAISITRAVTHQRIGLQLSFRVHELDAALLARAVRLTMDAEPMLGCALNIEGWRPYWSRMPHIDEATAFSAGDSADPQADMLAFQAEEIDDAGPQVAVTLLRGGDIELLGIKISHLLADGQAAKQYAYLLADTYSKLAADRSYRPVPGAVARPTGADVWARLTPEQRREAKRAKSWANPTWTVPSAGATGRGLTYSTVSIGPERFRRLKEYGKQRGATVNDVMLCGVFRAGIRLFDPPAEKPMSLMCTADLRRYLPEAATALANVSISGSLDIARVDGEDFDATLGRVRAQMEAWSRQCYGAGPFAGAEKLMRLGYPTVKTLLGLTFRMAGSSGKTYPWFTNIGVLDDTRLSFNGAIPIAGYMYGPAAIGASIVPLVSTYRDTLTVSMGYCESDMDPGTVPAFLDQLVAELAPAIV